MQKLEAELRRLYLAGDALVTADGRARGIPLAFSRLPKDGEAGHWERLCAVANALQGELDLPAPAVSISGAGAFCLWLSLETPAPVAQVQEFLELLCAAYCPELKLPVGGAPLPLPPFLHQSSGKWSAFIHPGMGVSFAGDEGLEVQPPEAGQVALLEGLRNVDAAQFAQALDQLRRSAGSAPQPAPVARPDNASANAAAYASANAPSNVPAGLLLKDATLEDIVAYLHSKNIEPTFRFLK